MAKTQIQRAKADRNGIEVHALIQDTPLPNAEELKRYQEVSPDIVPFLMEMSKREQEARHEVQRATIKAQEREQAVLEEQQRLLDRSNKRRYNTVLVGQLFALLCFIGTLALCFYSVYLQAYWLSGIVGTLAVSVVVQAFLKSKDKE